MCAPQLQYRDEEGTAPAVLELFDDVAAGDEDLEDTADEDEDDEDITGSVKAVSGSVARRARLQSGTHKKEGTHIVLNLFAG